MAGMGDDAPAMAMDLTLKCTCRVGKLLVPMWDIQTCGQYYASLLFIAVFCFLRHLLTMHKTKLILRLAEGDAGTWRGRLGGWPGLCSAASPQGPHHARRAFVVPRFLVFTLTRFSPAHMPGSAHIKRTSSMLGSMCCNTKPCSYGATTEQERQKLTSSSSRIEQGGAGGGGGEGEGPWSNGDKPVQRQLSEEAFTKLGQPMSMRARLVLTAYFALISASSLFVMLVAMTFNMGVVAAILLGEGAGHLAFASDYLHNLVDAGSFH